MASQQVLPLDLLTESQLTELQTLVDGESESPTVSERLAQMMDGVLASNPAFKAMKEAAQADNADKFATLLATPLYELDPDSPSEDEIDNIMQYA